MRDRTEEDREQGMERQGQTRQKASQQEAACQKSLWTNNRDRNQYSSSHLMKMTHLFARTWDFMGISKVVVTLPSDCI